MRFAFAFVVVALAVLGWSSRATACAPAPPVGSVVEIAGEEALILWDAEDGVEHFIRSADFESTAASFGFIVPTPSVPELAETDALVFHWLASTVAPRVKLQPVTSGFEPTCFVSTYMGMARDAAPAEGSIQVLKHQSVAGYDAVVLRSSDPEALKRWLLANDYEVSETLAAWANAYIERGWVFTAFKIAQGEGASGVSTSPVRMSFATERPFYPYREPTRPGSARADRTLRVFFVATERYAGALGDGTAWPGETTYARSFGPNSLPLDLAKLSPSSTYLTTFVDKSSPRPGDADLFFDVDPGGDVTPEPTIQRIKRPVPIPIELLVLVGGAVFWWRRRRK